MRALALPALPLALAFSVGAACSDAGTREQLTVVVAADRARALADQQRLAEMQESLAAAKQELVDTRADLKALREKLLATGAVTADEMKKLEERERALASRESKLPTSAQLASTSTAGAGGISISRAELEQLLKAQEDRIRASCASGSGPAVSSIPAPTGEKDRDDVVTQLAAVAELRSQRGLRDDDIEGGPALQRRIDDALKAKRYAAALDAVNDLRRKTESTVVNGAFVKRKYARASARLDVLSGDAKDRAKKLLGDANAKNAKGDAAGANEALNIVLELR